MSNGIISRVEHVLFNIPLDTL